MSSSKPAAALLIGKITHAREEWEALSSLATLKVSLGCHCRRNCLAMLHETFSHARKTDRATWPYQTYETGTRDAFLTALHAGTYNDVVAIYRSNESTSVTGPFNAELIAALPASLKFITHNGAGYDNIDVAACSERGIGVSSTPIAVNEATADVAMFLMLGALRRITIPFQAVRKGEWRGKGFGLGHDPAKKVLGILGMGGM
nr:putative 2-hydroxyacid dehydrogenase unk4.10 [Quercus suber]